MKVKPKTKRGRERARNWAKTGMAGRDSTAIGARVFKVEGRREGTGPQVGPNRVRMVEVGFRSRTSRGNINNPATTIANALAEAIDPTKQPGKVRTLETMTPEERAKLSAELGAPVPDKAVPRPVKYRIIESKFDPKHPCPECGKPIKKGMKIRWASKKPVLHEKCSTVGTTDITT